MWIGCRAAPCGRRGAARPHLLLAVFLLSLLTMLLLLLPWPLNVGCGLWAAPTTKPRRHLLVLLDEDLRSGSGRYHVDASGRYKVLPFAAVGADWLLSDGEEDQGVCLATHSTVGGSGEGGALLETLSSWSGPASVAIFDADPSLGHATRFLRRLEACDHPALARVSFHVIGPNNKSEDGTQAPTEAEGAGGEEDDAAEVQCVVAAGSSDGNQTWQKDEMLYPQNLARNTALRRCPSLGWVLTVDADMVPSPSLRRRLGIFLRGRGGAAGPHQHPRAFVVPTYEVVRRQHNGSSEDTPLPDTKASLLSLKRAGKARPFHVAVFMPNQWASKLSKWEARNASDGDDVISVAHEVSPFPFWYEPVYVVSLTSDLPPFDERFVGYGMTRNTQAYEMFLRGYTFEVLDNAFLVHWGFQEAKQRPKWRDKQTQRNYKFFKKWIVEKAAQYDADPGSLIQKMAGDQSKRNVVVQLRQTTTTTKATTTTTTEVAHTTKNGTYVSEQVIHSTANDTELQLPEASTPTD